MAPQEKLYTFFKGRVALHAILRAGDIGQGDQVILPGYTCIVVPNAVSYLGAEPVYIDIDPTTYNLDPHKVQQWLESPENVRTKAIIVQHTYGIPCDMDPLLRLARKHDLLVIEDSCHAIGSAYKGKQVGTFGDASFFSSQWSKPITTGLGGWAKVNNPALFKKLDAIYPEYSPPPLLESIVLNFQFHAYKLAYRPKLFWLIQDLYRQLGNWGLAIGSSTLSELSCEKPPDYMKSMGRIQVQQLNQHIIKMDHLIGLRRRQGHLIEDCLKREGYSGLDLPEKFEPVFLRYPLRTEFKTEVLAQARRHRIQLGDWFLSPVHPNLERWNLVGYQPGSCPIAEDTCSKIINLPLGPRMDDREIRRTIRFLCRFGLTTDNPYGAFRSADEAPSID